jgi:hypothetical protein
VKEEEDDRWGRSEEVFIPPQSPTKQFGPTYLGASALGRGGSSSRCGGSALARTEKNLARLTFCGLDYLRCRWSFEHLVPPSTLLVSPLIVRLVL